LSGSSGTSRHTAAAPTTRRRCGGNLQDAKTAHEKTAIERQIDSTDNRIDKLVYELYGLGEEEIGIVEGK